MSQATISNGTGSADNDGMTPAQIMQHRAEHGEFHNPTVEEVVDEEDIVHPPPSATATKTPASKAPPADSSEPMSEKKQGKQKEPATPQQAAGKQGPGLDTKSEESFPALGGGPKSRTTAPVPAAWGSMKPSAVASGTPNGTNGYSPARSTDTSRSATPGILTPSSTNASVPSTPGGPQRMSMPGRHSERVSFAPSQLQPRKDMKKPMVDVLRDINRKSKATIEMKPGPGGVVYFEGRGPVDAVRQALKDVANQVGSKQSVKVPIPMSVRPHVIGRQGATVQGISKRTGAHIQVPKTDSTPAGLDDDDDATIDVVIEGDAVAAEMARREIEAIVNDRTSTVNVRMKDVPAEFFPFLAGPHNSGISSFENGRDMKMKVPSYHTWTSQAPPQAPAPGQRPQFVPHPDRHIHLSGDRQAVQDARMQIEHEVEELRRRITLSQLAINRGQHQFIVGDDGAGLHDLLAETGCAVILPPDHDDSEMLTITGPHDRIESGIDKVMNLATSMQMSSIDVARQHNNAPLGPQAHAWALTRYLQQRQAVAQLERLYDSRINLPSTVEAPMTWEVYSREGKNTIRARSDIINVINAHPPSRFQHVEMNPFYYEQLRRQHADQIRRDFGVHVLVPRDVDEETPVFLVYEGQEPPSSHFELPRQRPSQSDVAQYEEALKKAQEHIMSVMNTQDSIESRPLEAPNKFHDKIRKYATREQENVPLPVQILNQGSQMNGNAQAQTDPGLYVRGPRSQVDSIIPQLLAFIEAEKQDELERGYTTTFDFPQKFANQLIGKKGDNINKLRDQFDVEIQINDGKVELKGPKAKTEAAKTHILAQCKKFEDETTHVLKIKPQFHREMIGAKGSQVNRLQDRYNVRVQFPRTATVQDDESVAEGETGGRNRSNQAPDEVVIRGPKKGADEAKDELLNLLQYTIDNSHGAAVSVAQGQLPSLIGQGGKEMESIREITGAKIDVPGSREVADPSGRVEIKVKGTKQQVDAAKKLLEQRAKTFDESISKSIEVEKKYHKALIGAGGSNIRNIVIAAGGADDRRELAKTVRFPKVDSDETTIRVEGNKVIAENIVKAIEDFVNQRENQIVEIVEVAPEKHRQLIGHGGDVRRNIESKFGVNVDIPKQGQQGPSRSQVKLTGAAEKVAEAKQHILELIKDQPGQTIMIPCAMHHTISDNGQFFRRLRTDHRVTVDHAGQQPPPKPTSNAARPRVNGNAASLPLITDDQDAAPSVDDYSWELIDTNAASSSDDAAAPKGEIPWVLKGSDENIAQAREVIKKAMEQASQRSSTGFMILPDRRMHRYVVGQGGSQINSIRRQTGCKITVPKDQAPGEAIEIVGSKEGVEEARDIILEVVRNGGMNGGGGRGGGGRRRGEE
ncbi:hypothetical protein MMC25_005936 [Agyrium rufum]|nr:hypothetical protein [Agyrium rufum]